MSDAPANEKRGCLRRSCFGCLALVGVVVAVVMVLALVTVVRGTPDVVFAQSEKNYSIASASGAHVEDGEPLAIDAGAQGRIELDVRFAEFSIVPAPAGEPLRLESNVDTGSYRLDESMAQEGELGWVYRLAFDRRSKLDFSRPDVNNKLVLHVPEGTPITLTGRVGFGVSHVELGGLWIKDVDLQIGMGEHRVGFDRPTVAPVAQFKLDSSIGELRIEGLGNASPANTQINHSIGEMKVGLNGSWRSDGEVRIKTSIGEAQIRLPYEDIALELEGASVTIGESRSAEARNRPPAPVGAPQVRLTVTHFLGELSLEH